MRFEMLSEPKPLPGVEAFVPQVEGKRPGAAQAARFTGRRPPQEMSMTGQLFGKNRFSAASIIPAGRPGRSGPRCGAAFAADARTAAKASCSRPSSRPSIAALYCGEEIHHHRADDLPAYLVVVIVGHIILGAFMGVEATARCRPGSISPSGCR